MFTTFGLPTGLLMVVLFFSWRVARSVVLPAIQQLVSSHLEFVSAVQDALAREHIDHGQIKDSIAKQGELLKEITIELRARRSK